MQAKRKNVIKKAVDVCMTAVLLCLMAYQVTGEALHEWLGIGMTVLFIVHQILNIKWYSSLFRGKYGAYRTVSAVINLLLFSSIALTAVCGMAMSAHAVPFLYGILPASFARTFHLALSYWSFILAGVHLGLHIPAITAGWKPRAAVKITLTAVFAVISCAGVWLFVKNGISDYILFRSHFSFFDYDKPGIAVFAENLAILTAFAFAGACIAFILSRKRRKNR